MCLKYYSHIGRMLKYNSKILKEKNRNSNYSQDGYIRSMTMSFNGNLVVKSGLNHEWLEW